MKKLFKISSLLLAAGMTAALAGCAGCSGSAKNLSLTNSNWYTGTSYKGIQPSFIIDDEEFADYSEKMVYDINFDNSTASNSTYSVQYTDGEFTTLFYATHYDWNKSIDAYKTDESELVYYYKTEMNIHVQFTMKSGEKSEVFTDSIVNECYFRAAGKNLQPLYSKQEVVSHSPANYQAASLASAYLCVNAVYENYYNYGCTEVTTYSTEDGEKTTFVQNLSKVTNSLFDNSSLYIAVRSMKLSDSLSQSVSLYSAAAGGVSTYTVAGTDTAMGAEERKTVSEALTKKGLYTPVTSDDKGNAIEDKGINTVAVNVNYTGGTLRGTTQTIWYAAIENADNNTARASMLKISIPLSYNLGTLNFVLKEVQSTLWS